MDRNKFIKKTNVNRLINYKNLINDYPSNPLSKYFNYSCMINKASEV